MLIGRVNEVRKLKDALSSASSEFIAVYGRRRVGKTYLIREAYDGRFAFYHTGIANAGRAEQIARFAKSMEKQGLSSGRRPRTWYDAFDALESALARLPSGKKVVFIDELPWMDSQRSGFVSALESFWNCWASARMDIVLVVCGSATSWMTDKLLNARGGLHNRLTRRIRLEPFTLSECERFTKARGIVATRRQLLEYYMAMGGVPYYWNYVEKDRSPAQNLEAMFFAADGELRDEYSHLYASLFKKPQRHTAIVTALGRKKVGMSRGELLAATALADNGAFSTALAELVECGFVRRYRMPGKMSHDAVYQLIDNFTLFHFRFLETPSTDEHFWSATVTSPAQAAWRGLAFERLCLLHLPQLRRALGIGSVHVEAYGWSFRGDETYPDGVQIDLVIDRADNVINVCEMKYSSDEFVIDKEYFLRLGRKVATFVGVTKTRKAVHVTFVTANGLFRNQYSGRVQSEVMLDDLFAP